MSGGPATGVTGARASGADGTRAAAGGDASGGVAPSLDELIALRSLALARGRVRHGTSGLRAQATSALRGRGMEYAESRAYAIGDDARHIDWRLTARSGKPHTKLYQAERERLSLLLVDTAPALYFGTRVRFKSVQAARAGAIAAWRAVADGDRVAALRGSEQEPPVPAAGGVRGALRVLDALVRWYERPPGDDAGLAVGLGHAARLLRSGSRLLVLADPASAAAVPAERWAAVAARHQVVAVLLTDPLEMSPPRAALSFASGGPGRGGRLELDLGDAAQRRRWDGAFADAVAFTVATLAARGVRAVALSTDASSDAWLAAAEGPH